MTVSTKNMDILTASLGKPVALAYGRHVVGGNVILKDDSDADRTIVFVALGEGEWDSIESLHINGAEVDITIPENFQFHKGRDGQLSTDGTLSPTGIGSLWPFENDGDQQVDAFTPPEIQGLTFSRTAYLALRIPFDPFAPGPEMTVSGVFRTRKVRIFDSSGVQLDYRYSENPAWQIADLLTVIRGLPDSRIDWASFYAAAAYCDQIITVQNKSVPRFQSHIAFSEEVDFDQALEALLMTCRGIITDSEGSIRLRIDQQRSAVFDFHMDNIVEGSFRAWRKDTRESPNRLELMFRDLENDFQVTTKLWNHEPQQARTGRMIPAKLHLGNLPQQQAERIGNYLLTRVLDNNLFCNFRATPASFAVMPGDVVRVKHDAAPWGEFAAISQFELFEVLEITESADESRELYCQLYRDATYPDTSGPTQNLIGTTVRRRQGVPPSPESWELSAYPRGHLWLNFKIPKNADYRTGELIVLADTELSRVKSKLAAPLGASDTTLSVTSSQGFFVNDHINIGNEILLIAGPGVAEVPPTSDVWQVVRAQKMTHAASAVTDTTVYRLAERNLHFALPPGFTLNRANKNHTIDFRPGRLRILHAALQFSGLGATSKIVELPFANYQETFAGVFGVLPGLRCSAGGMGTIQIPGPLATGADLAMPLILPEDVSIGLIYAQAQKSPFLASGGASQIGIQIKIDGENYGPVGLLAGTITGGPTGILTWLSGAEKGNAGGKAVSVEITEVSSGDPGEDLTIYVTI